MNARLKQAKKNERSEISSLRSEGPERTSEERISGTVTIRRIDGRYSIRNALVGSQFGSFFRTRGVKRNRDFGEKLTPKFFGACGVVGVYTFSVNQPMTIYPAGTLA